MAEGLSGKMLMKHRDAQEFFSTFRFGEAVLDLDTVGALQFQLGGTKHWISSKGDFLGTAPSYTVIRDPIMWLCNRLIACSIAGRSQALKKVISTDLFYLRGMDVGSVNVPYLLARYMRRFDSGRKHEAMIYKRQFFARLAEHFGLLTE
ncbi:hypothetical protein Tco_1013228, partial [Tanacetum coccineum]